MKLQRLRAVTCLHLVCILAVIACNVSLTYAFCQPGKRPAWLPRSVTNHCDVFRRTQPLCLSAGDNQSKNSNEKSIPEDTEALQNEVAEMILREEEEGESLTLYNAVPLFTGAIVFVVSIAATAYLYYAGLTGDDPLMGHPK